VYLQYSTYTYMYTYVYQAIFALEVSIAFQMTAQWSRCSMSSLQVPVLQLLAGS